VGQRTSETRSLYLILDEKPFTPAANEMRPLVDLFTGNFRECMACRVTARNLSEASARRHVDMGGSQFCHDLTSAKISAGGGLS